jgi:hypothetical protein
MRVPRVYEDLNSALLEVIGAHFKALSQYLHGWADRNYNKRQLVLPITRI